MGLGLAWAEGGGGAPWRRVGRRRDAADPTQHKTKPPTRERDSSPQQTK